MSGLELFWPWALASLPLPILARLLLPRAPTAPAAGLRVPFFDAMADDADTGDGRRGPWRPVLALLGWLLLVTAAARPQLVGDPVAMPVEGRDIMLAVDLSGSMATADMQVGRQRVSRLAAVKAVAGEFIDRRRGDLLGLILFGREAYVQTPLTFDRDTVRTLLDEAAIGLAGKETAIGDAIGLGIKRLRERPGGDRVMILLTDGANTAGSVDPLRAADLAAQEGVKIYTIGVGAGLGGGYFGVPIMSGSDLDEATLKDIAERTGGRYFRARDPAALMRIYRMIDELEPVSQGAETYRPRQELYAWPLGGALMLSMVLALGHALAGRRWFAREFSHG